MRGGKVLESGTFRLDGVAFPAAKVRMEFIDPAGQDGAGATFPTGHEIDRLDANEAIGKKIRESTRGSLVSPRVLSESATGRHHSPPEKPNSNRLTLLGNLAAASRITEKSYQDFLRQNQAEPCDGVRDRRAHKLHTGGLKRASHRMPRRATFALSAPRWSVVRNDRLRAD